ncbi:MAG: hypothetical protein WD053_06585 [Gracilimonas sp.]
MINVQAQSTISQEKTLSPFLADSSYYLGDWVLSNSIIVVSERDTLSSNSWTFDSETGTISFDASLFQENHPEATVYFERYPFNFPRSFQPRKPIEIDPSLLQDPDSLMGISFNTEQQAFGESNLQQSGSLSRGIIVGSNQDFSLESGLNFELNGALTDNININASLTDQSIPIQPDGTTQNLREFDKVFIQVQAPNASLEMGDVDVSLEQSTFARINRRLQGATGTVNSQYGDYSGAASVVRGTYKSMTFNGQDGVQGPYRLTGRNDREFVIILAGTERVYINGQRVNRGSENEYIIDYGLGEVTFTNNLLVKDETRIVIEYEYLDRDFNQTLVAAEGGDEFFDGRLKIGASVIRQADGDDLLSQQSLSQNDIEQLQNAGDGLDDTVVSGARVATEEERTRFIMYAEKDTTVNGETYKIYEHQPGSSEAIYRVQFTKVGEGDGSYRRISGEVNGLLYEWVGPGQGSYSPFRQLPAPQKQQMAAITGQYQLTDNIKLFGEWAASDFDANRFSSLDDNDNTDLAYESGMIIRNAPSALGEINARISRRYSGERFRFFERTREVEFDRRWNISSAAQSREALNEASLSISPTTSTEIGGEFGLIERDGFRGIRQASSISSNEENILAVSYNQDWVQSDDQLLEEEGDWFRHSGNLSKGLGGEGVTVTPYISFEQERRLQRNSVTDSLNQLSENFYDIGPGLRLELDDLELDAGIAYRKEQGVLENKLEDESVSLEHRYRLSYSPGGNFSTSNEVRIRQKNITEAFETAGNTNRKGLLIRSVTNYSTRSSLVDGELFYEANTRRQALLQETYIEVGPEIGQFIWNDLNNDGVQQVDEFFPEVSVNEGTFIRQYLPSDELFPSIDLNMRLLNTIRPLTNMDDENWMSGILLRSRIDIHENSTTQNLQDVYLLNLDSFRNDSTTIQGRILWEKELNLLSEVDRADLRFGYTESRGLNQRSTESLQSNMNIMYFSSEYSINERTRLLMEGRNSINKSESSRLQNRNYDIKTLSLQPGINTTINRSWNAGIEISYARKEDRFPVDNVAATLLKISTSHRTYLWRKLQSNFRMEIRNTTLSGNSSSYGNYELTEGTGEGVNYIWSVNSNYRLNNLIRFSFNYDGRTVRDRPAIHTIKLVMSATF